MRLTRSRRVDASRTGSPRRHNGHEPDRRIRRRRLASVIGGGMLAALAVTVTGHGDAGAVRRRRRGRPVADLRLSTITQAGIGVMAFGLRNLDGRPDHRAVPDAPPGPDRLVLRPAGLHGRTSPASRVDVYYEDDVGEGYPGVDCLSDIEDAVDPDPAAPHYPAIGAAYLPDGITFQDFLTGFEDQTILTPSVPGIGGEIGGVCIPSFCYLHWHRGSLVVSVLVAGGSGDITREKTEAMLTAMVPGRRRQPQGLAGHGVRRDPGSTTTVAAPTTAATPTTGRRVPDHVAGLPSAARRRRPRRSRPERSLEPISRGLASVAGPALRQPAMPRRRRSASAHRRRQPVYAGPVSVGVAPAAARRRADQKSEVDSSARVATAAVDPVVEPPGRLFRSAPQRAAERHPGAARLGDAGALAHDRVGPVDEHRHDRGAGAPGEVGGAASERSAPSRPASAHPRDR